ncbi:hypothetical protein E2C01_005215 [Portunus trituberculatus]|uniref:Uncharacterized protein n=1 Tax=Portunus trituberculatus TaxID=210409 RepID=A0A5B7CW14_PORTR|nr:hypothetical protein [Portunus trituberculatus]
MTTSQRQDPSYRPPQPLCARSPTDVPSPVEIDVGGGEPVGPQLRERNSLYVASPEPVQPANTSVG